jgi:acyl-CoA synthetase (AMP-forming)/AMP-acid ligase II
MQNFVTLLETQADTGPELAAITLNGNSVSYGELVQGMYNVAYHAKQHGMVPGEKLLFACKPDIKSLTLALGLIRYGITLTIVDPMTSDELFKNRVGLVGPEYAVGAPILYHLSKHRRVAYKLLRKQIADFSQAAPNLLSYGGTYKEATDISNWTTGNHAESSASYVSSNPAIIVFTSGTTSEPKGVVHTIDTLSASIEPFAELMGIKSGSKVYSEPMTLGLVALSHGAEWIIPGKEKRFPECDVWFATPADILRGLKRIRKYKKTPHLRTVAAGAAPVLPSLVSELESNLVADKILSVYGMTEMLPIAVGDARKKFDFLHQGDFVGKAVGDTFVVAKEKELFISGPALMKKYLTSEPLTELPTGDFGTVDDEGNIILQGRKKDMFIRGDMNVYPGLYEPGLATITGVKNVALIGIPDEYGDDEIVLAVTPLEGFSESTVKVQVEKDMAKFVDADAVPSEVVVLSQFPLSGRADKLDRTLLMTEVMKYRKR